MSGLLNLPHRSPINTTESRVCNSWRKWSRELPITVIAVVTRGTYFQVVGTHSEKIEKFMSLKVRRKNAMRRWWIFQYFHEERIRWKFLHN